MPTGKATFLDFVRLVVNGEIDQVSRRLAASPAFATAAAEVGAERHGAPDFFFSEIAHYLYAGDTALHMAAAAFVPPVAKLLVAHGADCRARNRRGAEPLHYAADANHWDPTAQARTIEYLLSVGRRPQRPGQFRRGRPCTGRCEHDRCSRCERFWMVVRLPGCPIKLGLRRCTWPFRTRGDVEAVLGMRAGSRWASSGFCWNAARGRPTKTGEADKCARRLRVRGFEPYLSGHPRKSNPSSAVERANRPLR